MLRAVLAVLVIAAIVAVSQPVVQAGSRDHAATMLRGEVDELIEEARDLVKTDEAVDGPGARRIVTVDLADGRRFSAGANYVEIAGGDPSTINWAVDGGTTHRRVVEGLRLRTPGGDPLRLEAAGQHRLVLRLTGPAGDPVVAVSRFRTPGRGPDA